LSEAAQVAAALPRGRGNQPRHEICSAIETSMSSSLNIARRWDVARWAPIPLRLIVGYGFIAHGYAKLVKDPDVFVGILHAIWHSRASWCHNVQSFCSWLSIRHRRYGGDLRSNQKDDRQCTEHLRRIGGPLRSRRCLQPAACPTSTSSSNVQPDMLLQPA
jgi:hypothetical protein